MAPSVITEPITLARAAKSSPAKQRQHRGRSINLAMLFKNAAYGGNTEMVAGVLVLILK